MSAEFWSLLALVLLAPVVAAAAPAGQVVIAQGVDPTTLDVMNQTEMPSAVVGLHIFEGLLERDAALKIVPLLAASLPRLVTPTTWEVRLRTGVRFHNGEDFDAASAKFSLERAKSGLRTSNAFRFIDRVEILDPHTVHVHTTQPWPTFMATMTLASAAMYPAREYMGKDTVAISRKPIGSGPYRFVRWVRDDELVLEASSDYWRGVPAIKTVIFRAIPDDGARVAALQSGEVDVAVNIPPHLAATIESHRRVFLTSAPSIRTIQLMFYSHQFDDKHALLGPYHGPTADRRVRQAITSAIDADAIVRSVLDGRAMRIATLLTPMHFGFDPQLKPATHDAARARRLLAEAGYPGGLEITLNGPRGRYVRDTEVMEAIAGQLARTGIKTTVRSFEFVTYTNSMVSTHRAGPVWLLGWGTPILDAEAVYGPLFRAGRIQSNYFSADLERLMDEAQTTLDEARRRQQYQRINQLLLDDAAAVPLYQQVDLSGVNRRLSWTARSDELIKAFDMRIVSSANRR